MSLTFRPNTKKVITTYLYLNTSLPQLYPQHHYIEIYLWKTPFDP